MRAFLAIDLPENLKEKIFAFSRKIARQGEVKLVEKENLHLTLLFLGEINEGEKRKVVGVLESLGRLGEIKLRLGKVEFFPDRKKPHGIWIKVEGEKEKLFALYKRIVEGVLRAGIGLAEKELRFSPHITIGRMRKNIQSFDFKEEVGLEGEEFLVERVVFFKSELSAKGPKYSKIAEFVPNIARLLNLYQI